MPDFVRCIDQNIGLKNAAIVDVVATTTKPTTKSAQPLHEDQAHGPRKLYKLAFSMDGRNLGTEFGESRTPLQAPSGLFDGVRTN
jgi:hypothetical protein